MQVVHETTSHDNHGHTIDDSSVNHHILIYTYQIHDIK